MVPPGVVEEVMGRTKSVLEYDDQPNYTMLFGLLQACQPHFNMSETNRRELEYLVLGYVAKHPVAWALVRDHLEQTLADHYADNIDMGRPAGIRYW